VRFDGAWALKREEKYGDLVGFLHTHPDGPASPSTRDVRTMRTWCSAFGKPLLCLISSPEGLRGYRFDNDESAGEMLAVVEPRCCDWSGCGWQASFIMKRSTEAPSRLPSWSITG
jgi:hypothetical protein